MSRDTQAAIHAFLAGQREAQQRFLAELVKLPSDNPPGDCRPRILLARPFTPLPGQEKLVGAIRTHAERIIGEKIETHGVPLYTDARHYAAAGIPTVLYGAGPKTLEEANGHQADENLKLDDLYKATEVIALSLSGLLSIEK